MELSELIESVDILEYISQYTEFTEKNGEYWALSPLKSENTPSFSVRRESGTFYDFSSGIGGNVLTFVRYYNQCGYAEAIEKLKAYAGVDGELTSRKRLPACEVARRFRNPPENKNLQKMASLSDSYMSRFEKRNDKLAIWEREGIAKESLSRFGVCYDGFTNRLVYPIRGMDGKIVNVGGRTLDEDWKEKRIRKYTYFKPWNNGMQVIYGLFENMESIQKSRQIILFEGAKSVMLADSYGVKNTGALLTSHMSAAQFRILLRLGCDVVLALDKDVNVREDRNIRKLKQFVNVSFIWDQNNLTGEKDSPIDRGKEVWESLYQSRRAYH